MNILTRSIFLVLVSLLMVSCGDSPEKPTSPKKTTAQETTAKPTAPSPTEKSDEKPAAKVEEKAEEPAAKVIPTPPEHLKKAAEILAAVDEKTVGAVEAKKKFKMFCAACHGFTGDLMVNGAKDLTASKISMKESVAQIYHGKGLMTPFKGILKDDEIVAVAKYIETLRK